MCVSVPQHSVPVKVKYDGGPHFDVKEEAKAAMQRSREEIKTKQNKVWLDRILGWA